MLLEARSSAATAAAAVAVADGVSVFFSPSAGGGGGRDLEERATRDYRGAGMVAVAFLTCMVCTICPPATSLTRALALLS